MSNQNCIFCKLASGDIPSETIYETDNIIGFMDNNPLSEGHCLFIPKEHASKMHETGSDALKEILIAIKEVAIALELEDYNILQNNGKIAHQAVMHSHFHLIPKPTNDKGLTIGWTPHSGLDQEKVADKIRANLE